MARNVIPLTNLIEQFERMPGIGHKSAQKLAFYILGMSDDEVKRFAQNAVTNAETVRLFALSNLQRMLSQLSAPVNITGFIMFFTVQFLR